MMKALTICSLCLLTAATTFAQDNANPLSSGQKFLYGFTSKYLLGAAEKMPEANYSYKPTADVRSFGQIVGHAADSQYMFCSTVLGEKNPKPNIEKTKASKAELVAALKKSTDYCMTAYTGMTDTKAAEMIDFFGGQKAAKLTVLSLNTAHNDEHYGNMVTYLRMKKIVPPSSEKSAE